LVASDPNSFMTAVSGAILTRIDDKSYLYVDPNNKDNTFWYDASDLQIILPFTISAISNLQLWFDSRDPAANGSQPAEGSKLSTWNDKSNNKFNTTNVNGNPIYNKNGVIFDGNSYFDLPNGSIPFNDSSYAIYIVGNIANSSGLPGMIGGGNVNGPVGAWVAVSGYNNRQFQTAWNLRNTDSGTTYTDGQTFLHFTMYESEGQRSIGFNGVVTKTDKPSGPRVQPNTNNVLGWATNVGKMNGSLSEVLVFNISHTDTQRQIVEGYLAWKWGLQSNLPNNHPFKSAAPSGSTQFPKITNYLENVSFVRIAPSNSDSGMSYIEISQIVIKDENDVNIAKTGSITQKGGQPSLLQNYPLQKLIEGNEQILEWPNQWAPIQNSSDAKTFFIEVALSKPTNIKEVNILTRQSTPWYFNSVMQTVQFLDSNRNLLATRSFPGNSVTKQVINKLGPNIGTPGLIKFVRIERSDPNSKEGSIQIAQLQVFDLNNVNVAKYQIAKSKDGYPAEYAVDGVELNGPGDRGGQMSVANDWWELTLGAPTAIKQIKFYNRGCCYERMEPYRIVLLDKDRNVIHNTSNFTKDGVQIFNITGKAAEKS